MAKQLRTYFLCPHFDYPPSSIKLGHIIPSPSDPSNALNLDDVEPVDLKQIHCSHKYNWIHRSSDGSAGILPKFLQIFGFGSIRDGSEDVFKCDEQETMFFLPTKEYLEKAIQTEGVQMYLSASRFKKPLYMITGLKIARGGKSSRTTTHEREGGFDIGVDNTLQAATGVPVTVGPGIQVASSWSESRSFQSSEDFVFAFRLHKLILKRKRVEVSKWSQRERASPLGMELGVDLKDAGTGGIRDVVADEMLDENEERSPVVVLYSAETYTKGAMF